MAQDVYKILLPGRSYGNQDLYVFLTYSGFILLLGRSYGNQDLDPVIEHMQNILLPGRSYGNQDEISTMN